MPKSYDLRLEDARALIRIVGECRDRGNQVRAWRAHFFSELGELIGAELVLGGELGGMPDGSTRNLDTTQVAWEHGFDQSGWLDAIESHDENASESKFLNRYLPHFLAQDGVAPQRTEFIPDGEWCASGHYLNIRRTVSIHHALYCFRAMPCGARDSNGAIVCRPPRQRAFSKRERLLAQELHRAIAPLIGGALARYGDPSAEGLTPRAREVLRALLEGDGDKQIARRLRISEHTVNQYTKIIYRHFGIGSRAELLAVWIRRSWSV